MPKYRQPDGTTLDIDLANLVNDDNSPFNADVLTAPHPEQRFTAADLERVRSEEKDKLYPQITELKETIGELNNKVGTLSQAEEQRLASATAEKDRLEAEARAVEEKELSAHDLLLRKDQEWNEKISGLEKTWQQRFEESEERTKIAEAAALKEREFADLRDYVQAKIAENQNDIAPQLLAYIGGNSTEEVDASIARAKATTEEIIADLQAQSGVQQQTFIPGTNVPVPQPGPGTRITGGPGNVDPAAFSQQLTAEQIANMPMAEYAKLRPQLIKTNSSTSGRGLYG